MAKSVCLISQEIKIVLPTSWQNCIWCCLLKKLMGNKKLRTLFCRKNELSLSIMLTRHPVTECDIIHRLLQKLLGDNVRCFYHRKTFTDIQKKVNIGKAIYLWGFYSLLVAWGRSCILRKLEVGLPCQKEVAYISRSTLWTENYLLYITVRRS
jgi:hypothetical protein